MIAFEDAQRAALDLCVPLDVEIVPLLEAAGRIAAVTVTAGADLVPFARSAMDGYAVASSDLITLPVTLPIARAAHHARGTATAIATGAALPAGVDAVVPYEDAAPAPGGIRIELPTRPGDAVFPAGDDARRGDVLFACGTPITPAVLGILAAAGHAYVAVHRRPRVAIICGGDEIVPVEHEPAHGQIRESNGAVVAASVSALGAAVVSRVIVRDTRTAVRAALEAALDRADLVVSTGGASRGERDFIKPVAAELGIEFAFEAVALRPAKPTGFGRRGATLLAALPGNPAATFVALHEFVGPALRRLSGQVAARAPRVTATLAGSLHARPERTFAAFAAMRVARGGLVAEPLPNQCSSLTRAAVDCCGLIVVPPGLREYETGDTVEVDIVDWGKLGHAFGS